MPKCCQDLVLLKNLKQNNFLFYLFLFWKSEILFVARKFFGLKFCFLVIIVSIAIVLTEAREF